MKRHLVSLAAVLIAGLVLAPSAVLAQAKDASGPKTKKEMSEEISAMEVQAAAQAEKLEALESEQAALKTALEETQQKAAAAEVAEGNRAAVEKLTDEVDALNQKVEAQAAELAAKDAELKNEIDGLAPTKGFTIKGPGESSLKIGALLQARVEAAKDAAPAGDNWNYDTYLRRMRLMFYGQLNKWVNFFIETDNPNFGKDGTNWAGSTFIQDAYLELNIHEAFQIDMGMLLVPFSHHGMQGATSLLGMDYHSQLIKYPAGGHKVWRDAGVMIRGLFARDHVEYRLGLFNGVHGGAMDPRNPDDLPRLTGRLTFNIFDPEGGAGAGGMFYDGLYISKTDGGVVSTKRVLSIGSSVDWQPDLNVQIENPERRLNPDTDSYVARRWEDYIATSWDVFFDIPFGESKLMSLNGQVNLYYYYFGDRGLNVNDAGNTTTFWYYDAAEDTSSFTGFGLSSEIGFRYSAFQPLLLVDFFNATKSVGDTGDYLSVAGGFNYYLFGHNTTFKLQVGGDQANKSDDWGVSAKFQAQLVF